MKKLFLSAALAVMTFATYAQDFGFVSRSTEDGESRWSVNLLGLTVENTTGNRSRLSFSLRSNDYGKHGFFFGVSNLASDNVELKAGNSLEFGIPVLSMGCWNDRRTFGLLSSVDISWTRYGLKNNHVIYSPNPLDLDAVICDRYPADYSRSRLTYASWRLPLEMAFSKGNCLFTAGVEGELRHHLRSRVKMGKDKKHYIQQHELGVNPWGVNAVASFGVNGISVFGRMALTEFFDTDKTDLRGTPFMVGIRYYTK